MNAAIWFGGSVFFTFAVATAFFTPEMHKLLGETYSGIVGFKMAERYFMLQYWCGAVALAHQLAERIYLSKPLHRLTMSALLSILALGLAGGVWFQPKLTRLHQVAYGRAELFTPAQKAEARRALNLWQGVSSFSKYLALGALFIYTWQVVNATAPTRFAPASKFRS